MESFHWIRGAELFFRTIIFRVEERINIFPSQLFFAELEGEKSVENPKNCLTLHTRIWNKASRYRVLNLTSVDCWLCCS